MSEAFERHAAMCECHFCFASLTTDRDEAIRQHQQTLESYRACVADRDRLQSRLENREGMARRMLDDLEADRDRLQREVEEMRARCEAIAREHGVPNRYKPSETWRDDMTVAEVYETGAIDVAGWIADAIAALSARQDAEEEDDSPGPKVYTISAEEYERFVQVMTAPSEPTQSIKDGVELLRKLRQPISARPDAGKTEETR